MIIGVDIGGTFTDVVTYDAASDRTMSTKVLTDRADIAESVLAGIKATGSRMDEVSYFIHGTTIALNTLLERNGARTALVTTRGFRDVYEIARCNRTEMYDLFYSKPVRLIERADVFEVSERILADGTVEIPLEASEVTALLSALGTDYDAVAVCLLHSYQHPEHELALGTALEIALPGTSVSLSHVVVSEWREYERTATTVANAYIAPAVEAYLGRLATRAAADGLSSPLHMMQSSGGVLPGAAAQRYPMQMLLSGPVGGAVGAGETASAHSLSSAIAIDMGGTSFDVSLVKDGSPVVTTQKSLAGFPLLMTSVDIHTIGAGGGSVIHTSSDGLRVGPRSAGGSPGPACYGRGGEEPTVTDANVVLGRINPIEFSTGSVTLKPELAQKALAPLANQLGQQIEAFAEGAIEVVDAMMANAIRTLTVEEGRDPSEFEALIAFGGAGPLHGPTLASRLGIPTTIIPRHPGMFSALGMMTADVRRDSVRSFFTPAKDVDLPALREAYDRLIQDLTYELESEGFTTDRLRVIGSADLRYVGQEFYINLPIDHSNLAQELERLREAFNSQYLDRFGHYNENEEIEFVNVRVTTLIPVAGPRLNLDPTLGKGNSGEPLESVLRPIFHNGRWLETPTYQRQTLRQGSQLAGSAVIEEPGSTTFVPEGSSLTVHPNLDLVVKLDR